jgi:hypothetical protein
MRIAVFAAAAALLLAALLGGAWWFLDPAGSDGFTPDPEACGARGKQLPGRWDCESPTLRVTWVFSEDGTYEYKHWLGRGPGPLPGQEEFRYVADEGTWEVVGVRGDEVKVSLKPGKYDGHLILRFPAGGRAKPARLTWLKYSGVASDWREYTLAATSADEPPPFRP